MISTGQHAVAVAGHDRQNVQNHSRRGVGTVRGNNRTRTNGASTHTDACLREAAAADIVLLYPEPTSASSARSWRSAQGCRARVRVDKLCTRRGKLAPAHHVVPVTAGGPALPELSGLESRCDRCDVSASAHERR